MLKSVGVRLAQTVEQRLRKQVASLSLAPAPIDDFHDRLAQAVRASSF